MGILGLARTEFALTVVFHYLVVALSLGLVLVVAVAHTRYARTGDPSDAALTRFWGSLYVINYAVGIGAGLAMEFQMGANWAGLEDAAGSVVGAPLAVETVAAFFVESTFLGLWIFGWRVLPRRLHVACIWVVTAAAYASAAWALVANGFMQSPVAYRWSGGRLQSTDLLALLTNPNSWIAVLHIVGGALAAGGFFVLGTCVLLVRRQRADRPFLHRSVRYGAFAAAAGGLLLAGSGLVQFSDLDRQPAKAAAFTGRTPELDRYLADVSARFGPVDFPPTWVLQTAAVIMLAVGALLLVIGVWALVALRGDRILAPGLLQRVLLPAMALPFAAVIAGWVFREVGRQPFVIDGLLTTAQAVTPSLTAGDLTLSLIVLVGAVGTLLTLGAWLLARTALRGPAPYGRHELWPTAAAPAAAEQETFLV
jgi:cytochrome bd ubiquinol oxidase subunit I